MCVLALLPHQFLKAFPAALLVQVHPVRVPIKINKMEQQAKTFWDQMKGQGKGNASNKKQKTQKGNPWRRLLVATSKLALATKKEQRIMKADLTHTALFPNPPPEEFREAIETTTLTKNDRTDAAKATWMSAIKGVVTSKKSLPPGAMAVLKKHYAEAKALEESVKECRAVITHNQTQLLLSWWLHNLPAEETAFQEVVVALGAVVKHGPAPPFAGERETADALAAALASVNASGASSSFDL